MTAEAVTTAETIETTAEMETATEESTAQETTTAVPKAPATIPEIVAYYNAAANRVKADKPGYSFTERTSINSINGGAQWLVSIVNRAITDDTPQAETVATGGNHRDFAVPGKDWASKLSAAAVHSATCAEKDGVYEIRIDMRTETQPDLPGDVEQHEHGKAFKIYDRGKIYGVMSGYEALGKITKFAPTYHDCYILCAIDKSNGTMRSAQYYYTFDATIEGKLASAIPVKAGAGISVTGKYVF